MKESNLLSLSYGQIVVKDINANDGLLPESFETYQIVQPDDIVWRLTDLQNDKRSLRTAIVDQVGIITSAYLATKPKDISPKFLNYLLRAYDITKVFYSMGGGLRQSMKFSDVKRLPIILPPESEQCSIAAFLDRETAKIDALVDEQMRLIEVLKEKRQAIVSQAVTKGLNLKVAMKASNVACLGDVPQHWKVTRLKFLMNLTPGFAFKSEDFVDEGIQLIRIGNLYLNQLSLGREPIFLPPVFASDYPDAVVTAGDLLMSLTGTLGKKDYGYAVLLRSPDRFLLNQRVCRLRCGPNISHTYAEYFLQSEPFTEQIHRLPFGTKQANLASDDVLGAWVPIPPRREQDDISAFLDAEGAKLDTLTTEAQRAIDLLQERRTALISAAVTGKIDVRGSVPVEAEPA
jgi:type I restriction enzyme S subunit